MRNELMIFENTEFGALSVVSYEGSNWFIASEISGVLGYAQTNNMNKLIDSDDKTIRNIQIGGNYINQSLINESGLYAAIFGSTLPNARRFKRWVTSEVLPEIRRTGSYSMDRIDMTGKPSLSKLTQDLGEAIKMASHFGLDENQSRLKGNTIVRKIHGVDCMALCEITHLEYAPNVQYFTPTELGSTMNMSAKQINRLLQEKGFQKETRDHRNKLKWIVTEEGKKHSRLFDTGKIKGDGTPIQQVKWSESVIR